MSERQAIETAALVERCENAPGPDRRLDLDIFEALGCWIEMPPLTASLDAAMTLVPKDYHVLVQGLNDAWFALVNSTASGRQLYT